MAIKMLIKAGICVEKDAYNSSITPSNIICIIKMKATCKKSPYSKVIPNLLIYHLLRRYHHTCGILINSLFTRISGHRANCFLLRIPQ